MRSKSPELMSEIKKYIEDYYLQNRQSPSTTKITEAVGIARGTAYKYLVEMAEKNMIEYDGQEIRTNVTRKYSGEQTQTPIVGSIPCGSPQYEEENIEEYVLFLLLFSAKETNYEKSIVKMNKKNNCFNPSIRA